MINYGYIIVSAACNVFARRDLTSDVEGCRDVQHPLSVSCVVFVWHCCSMPAPIDWPYEPYRGEIQALFIVVFIDMDGHFAANVMSIEGNQGIIDSSVSVILAVVLTHVRSTAPHSHTCTLDFVYTHCCIARARALTSCFQTAFVVTKAIV